MFSKFIWVTLIQKQQKYILKKETLNFGPWAPYFIMICYIFPRMPNMQVLCSYYVKNHMKAMLHWQMCGCIFKIWAQWIDYKTTD